MKTASQGAGGGRGTLLYDGGKLIRRAETLIDEIPLQVWFNGVRLMTIACAGRHVAELAVGFLRAEGLLQSKEELAELAVSPDGRQVRVRTVAGGEAKAGRADRTLASSGACGIGAAGSPPLPPPLYDALQVTPAAIFALMTRFLEKAALHGRTGGTHAAALVRDGEILAVREDIGRHNTIDMLGGYTLLEGLDCSGTLILRTGRVSAEIVQKVRRLGVPLVVSLSVPTALAVELAEQGGLTLIGSVREGRMKIYSQEGRVLL